MSKLAEQYNLANSLFKQGRLDEARQAFGTLLTEDPTPTRALQMLAAIAFSQNQTKEAIAYSERLLELDPDNLQIILAIGQAHEKTGHLDAALEAYRRAAQKHRGSALAYLFIGSVLQQKQDMAGALNAYGLAFVVDRGIFFKHEQATTPPFVANRSRRGGDFFDQALAEMQQSTVDELETGLHVDLSRIRETVWYTTHQGSLPYREELQRPEGNYIPGLEPVPVFDKARFSWAEDLEAQFPDIRDEILHNLNLDSDEDVTPYLAQGLSDKHPLKELSGDMNWSSVHLYKDGLAHEATLRRFPRTTAALKRVTHTTRDGQPLEVFVSALKPGTAIAPHFGLTNAGVTVHLPILIPEGDAAIRVARHKHTWREGELFFFDDAFEHEAWNNTGGLRIVLIFEVWNPDLTAEEQIALDKLVTRRAEWIESLKPDELL